MTEATGVPVVAVVPVKAAVVKPGWQTSEFYMSWFAKIMGALVTSGLLGDGTQASRIAGLIVIILAQAGYTYSRTVVKTAAMMFALLMMSNAVMNTGCGPSARTQTIRATLIATNAVEQSFVAFDQKTQENIIANAKDKESGLVMLDAWRKKRIEGQDVMIGVYRAIAVAATLSDDASLQGMLSTFAILKQQLTTMGVTL